MPVADTEVLFALSPRDPKHSLVMQLLASRADVVVPDVAVLEFQLVLRARGKRPAEVRTAMLALHEAIVRHGMEETQTLSTSSLSLQSELEERYGLSYFDSLVAAAALVSDGRVISDDEAFDRVPGLERISLKLAGR